MDEKRRSKRKKITDDEYNESDDDDEEYLYFHGRRSRNISLMKHPQDSDETNHIQNQDDEKNYFYSHHPQFNAPVTTLSQDESELSSFKVNEELLLRQISKKKKWSWGFCVSTVSCVVLLLLCIFFMMYYLFFRTPYIVIQQAQVWRIPVGNSRSELFLGLKIIFEVFNPNVQTFDIESVTVVASVESTESQYTKFKLQDQPLQNISSAVTMKGGSINQFEVKDLLYIGDYKSWRQIQHLITMNTYALSFVGKVRYRLGPFSRYQDVYKHQVYIDISR